MPLVREWMRGLSGASGAALLVPGGIFAALLLLALAGSFGRLGGLGQAFTGPAAPAPAPVTSSLGTSSAHGVALLPIVAAPARTGVPSSVRPGTAGGGPSASGRPAAPSGGSPSGSGGAQPTPTAPGSPSTPPAAGCGSSCSQPPPHQTLIDQVVGIATSVTSKLPAVGQLTTQLLKQVGSTVDKVLPTDRRANVVTQVGSALSQLKLP